MKSIHSALGALAQRVHDQDRRYARGAPQELGRPAADPYGARAAQQHSVERSARILRGRVIDTLPGAHWYKVQLEGGRVPLPCCALTQGAAGGLGARVSNPYPPGTRVLVSKHHHDTHGEILGAEPEPALDARRVLSDQVSMSSHCGMQVDRIHQSPFFLSKRHGITDWNAGRPSDALAGDWTVMADTGTGVHVDHAMAYLRSDEDTGVFAFYRNQRLRVAGHNYQHWSAGVENEIFDDAGELSEYRGQTPYAWENMGLTNTGQAPYQRIDAEDYQTQRRWLASVEPLHEDQEPFHRVMSYGGYLGQGEVTYVAAPGVSFSSDAVNRRSAPLPREGLLEERRLMDGTWGVRSARRITLSKTPAVTVPTRIRRPNDPAGDAAAYDFAGGRGTHLVFSGASLGSAEEEPAQRAATIWDQQAYLWNWQGCHPFAHHRGDFHFPEEAATGRAAPPPSFGSLSALNSLRSPGKTDVLVDHRYGRVPVYQSTSVIDMLDDGGIVIGDGYGSGIVMTGGHIYLQCPGDVFLCPGRNLLAWAGKQFSVRGREEGEVSVSTGSLRLKADRHLMASAGNSGTGALLLEGRSRSNRFDDSPEVGDEYGRGQGGVQIKSKGDLSVWGQQIYLRTGGGDVGVPADIILDAGKGQGNLVSHANNNLRYTRNLDATFFGQEGNVRRSNVFTENVGVIDSQLTVRRMGVFESHLVANSGVFVADGHVYTSQSKNFSDLTGRLEKDSLRQTKEIIRKQGEELREKAKSKGEEFYDELDRNLYESGKCGDDGAIKNTGFSFRKTDEYGASGFVLFDARWQTLSRAQGGGTLWTERSVRQGDEQTYPFPGRSAFTEAQALRTVAPTFYDPATGVARARSNFFDSPFPALPAPQQLQLQGGYLVTG